MPELAGIRELRNALNALKADLEGVRKATFRPEDLQGYVKEVEELANRSRMLNESEKKRLDFVNKQLEGYKKVVKLATQEFAIRGSLNKNAQKRLGIYTEETKETSNKINLLQREMGLRSQLAGITKKGLLIGQEALRVNRIRAAQVINAAKKQQLLLKQELIRGNLSAIEAKRKASLVKIYDVLEKKTKDYVKLMKEGASPKALEKAGKEVWSTMKDATKAEKAGGVTMMRTLQSSVTRSMKRLPNAMAKGMSKVMGSMIKGMMTKLAGAGGIGLLIAGFWARLRETNLGKMFAGDFWKQFGAGTTTSLSKAIGDIGTSFDANLSSLRRRYIKTMQQLHADGAAMFQVGAIQIRDGVGNIGTEVMRQYKEIQDVAQAFFHGQIEGAAKAMVTFRFMGKNMYKTMLDVKNISEKTGVPFDMLRQKFLELSGDAVIYGTGLRELGMLQESFLKQVSGAPMRYGIKNYEQMTSVMGELTNLQEQGTIGAQMWMMQMHKGIKGLEAVGAWRYGVGARLERLVGGGFEVRAGGAEVGAEAGAVTRYGAMRERALSMVEKFARFGAGGFEMAMQAFKDMTGMTGLSREAFRVLVGKKLTIKGIKELEEAFKGPEQINREQLREVMSVDDKLAVISEQLRSIVGRTLLLILNAVVGLPIGLTEIFMKGPSQYLKIMGAEATGLWESMKSAGGMLKEFAGKDVGAMFPMMGLWSQYIAGAKGAKEMLPERMRGARLPGPAGDVQMLYNLMSGKGLGGKQHGGTLYGPHITIGAEGVSMLGEAGAETVTPAGAPTTGGGGVNVNVKANIDEIVYLVADILRNELNNQIINR